MSDKSLTGNTAENTKKAVNVYDAIKKTIAEKRYMSDELAIRAERFLAFSLSSFSKPASLTKYHDRYSSSEIDIIALCNAMGAEKLLKVAKGYELPSINVNQYGVIRCYTNDQKGYLFSFNSVELLRAYIFAEIANPCCNLTMVKKITKKQLAAGSVVPNMFTKFYEDGAKSNNLQVEYNLGLYISFLLIDCILASYKPQPLNLPQHALTEYTKVKFGKTFTNNGSRSYGEYTMTYAVVSPEELKELESKFTYVNRVYEGGEASDWFYYKTPCRRRYAFCPSLGIYRNINIREHYNI